MFLFLTLICRWNISSGIWGVPFEPSCKQDHLCQGGQAGRHHQLSETQRPQRSAQRLVAQAQLPHVSGQQDHASDCQGGDDPQPAVNEEQCASFYVCSTFVVSPAVEMFLNIQYIDGLWVLCFSLQYIHSPPTLFIFYCPVNLTINTWASSLL